MDDVKIKTLKDAERYFFDLFTKNFLEAFKEFLDKYQENLEGNRQEIVNDLPQGPEKEREDKGERELLVEKVKSLAGNYAEIIRLSRELEEDAKNMNDPDLKKEIKHLQKLLDIN